MRRANDSQFLTVNNDPVIGINLGADFTSEHEWGIQTGRREVDEKVFPPEKDN